MLVKEWIVTKESTIGGSFLIAAGSSLLSLFSSLFTTESLVSLEGSSWTPA
jgi:hypothetical protein